MLQGELTGSQYAGVEGGFIRWCECAGSGSGGREDMARGTLDGRENGTIVLGWASG